MKKQFGELTAKNYIMFAMRNYDNPQCLDLDEFHSDLNRIKYLKRLFKRYVTTGELKERLILNHIIVLYNVFGIVPATRLLFFRVDPEYHSLLKSFIVYLSFFPEGDDVVRINEADLIAIPLDNAIVEVLREI